MSSYGDEESSNDYMTTPYQPPEFDPVVYSDEHPYGPEDDDGIPGFANDQKPKILLMGPRRSGKSSIQNVVFHKMSPNETMFLESTSKITTNDISNATIVQFKIFDFPGQIDFFDPSFNSDKIFGGVGAVVFVIDAQDDYIDAVSKVSETFSRVFKINPKLKFEVFIHKVDGLTEDTKLETQREVYGRVFDDLKETAVGIPGLDMVPINFYLTSIYDHSIFEAFSKVIQKLIPQLSTLEQLINIFNASSRIEKSFLFDINSKIYMATDNNPVDMQIYELCCDMLDVVLDISYIYGLEEDVQDDNVLVFDKETFSSIKLDNSTVLLLWQVAPCLAFVCILREENYIRPGIIEYNFNCFRTGLLEVLEVRKQYMELEQQELDDNPGPSGSSGQEQSSDVVDGNEGASSHKSNISRKESKRDLPDLVTQDRNAPNRPLSDAGPRGAVPGDSRTQTRFSSAAVGGSTSEQNPNIVTLQSGQFIQAGGPDSQVTAPSTDRPVDYTYIMNDSEGLVLVNGPNAAGSTSTDNAPARS